MHSPLPRSPLVSVVLLLALRSTLAAAEPAATPTAPASEQQAAARKLTAEAIAAEGAKDYATAVALYKRAYALVPHPILMFNIGQIYALTGDLAQAEKFYLRYLERDPDGPGAADARKFLASRPAPPPVPIPPPPSPSPSSPSPLATTTAPSPRGAGNASTGGEHSTAQLAPEVLPKVSEGGPGSASTEAPATTSARAREDQLKRGKYFKVAGYTVLGFGAALAATIVATAPDDGEVVFYASAVAVGLSVGGMGLAVYGERQQRAAQQAAWAPVIGPGFAGVAWSGVLP